MSTKLSFKEALELREETKERPPVRSGSPVRLNLAIGKIQQPVDVARFLRSHGLSLRKAHEALDRLAARETVAVELYAEDAGKLISELSDLGVKANPIMPPQVDAKQVRERLGLTQAEFALRFCLELDTVQNWEQGRYRPDPAAQLLLSIIETDPKFVDSVLAKRSLVVTDG
jgi:DNA-binding transcriptional regulator YiaG